MKTAAIIIALVALFGFVGTPDYVLEIERENDALRARVASLEGSQISCRKMIAEVSQ